MSQPFWEQTYNDLTLSTFGQPSQEVRDVAAELPPGAKVLDLGCGEGRNALFLAEAGFDVSAVDISEAGIGKLRALADERGLDVRTEVADIRDYRISESYDLIMAHGCLHLIERPAWRKAIDEIKAHTNPSGVNIVVVFTDTIPPPDDLRDFCIGLFREGELFQIYGGWEIMLQRSYVFEDQHPDSPPHTHPVNKLVARRRIDS